MFAPSSDFEKLSRYIAISATPAFASDRATSLAMLPRRMISPLPEFRRLIAFLSAIACDFWRIITPTPASPPANDLLVVIAPTIALRPPPPAPGAEAESEFALWKGERTASPSPSPSRSPPSAFATAIWIEALRRRKPPGGVGSAAASALAALITSEVWFGVSIVGW